MQTAAAQRAVTQGATRDPLEQLTRSEIAAEYKIPVATQCAWFSRNRYGWRDICLRVGARVKVRRRDLEAWLESRRGLVVIVPETDGRRKPKPAESISPAR